MRLCIKEILRQILGQWSYSIKKPQLVPGKVNSESQKEFVSQYRQLKSEVCADRAIYFVDSVHPQHQTRLAYGWIMKCLRKNIATTGKQKRLNYMGGALSRQS